MNAELKDVPPGASLQEAAGRCAATLTTRLIEAVNKTPPGMPRELDPATLQSTLLLAFEQGANWAMDQAQKILMKSTNPLNRRPT